MSIAILPASGIGDALLMMIAAHQFKQAGHAVTIYHNHLPQLQSWFPGHDIRVVSDEHALSSHQLIVAENDNSPKMKELIRLYRPILSLFYPSYKIGKHPPLGDLDQCFNSALPMADNVGIAVSKLLGLDGASKENGIMPPLSLKQRSNPLQVLIHPTSSCAKKNWSASKFLRLATQLRIRGFSPLFVVSPREKVEWIGLKQKGFALAETATLSDLAALVYESSYVIGNDSLIGHLASNLAIPSLIIADCPERLKLWRPGWKPGCLVFPPTYLPRKIRKNYWQYFVSVDTVLQKFDAMQEAYNQ